MNGCFATTAKAGLHDKRKRQKNIHLASGTDSWDIRYRGRHWLSTREIKVAGSVGPPPASGPGSSGRRGWGSEREAREGGSWVWVSGRFRSRREETRATETVAG